MKKTLLLFVLMIAFSIQSAFAVSLKGQQFEFKNGPTEWSEPIELSIRSVKMEKNNVDPVKLKIRVRATKKILMGCRYEVEVSNVDTKGLRFAMRNSDNKLSFKLKGGDAKNGIIDSFTKGCKGIESCGECACDFYFEDIEAMK